MILPSKPGQSPLQIGWVSGQKRECSSGRIFGLLGLGCLQSSEERRSGGRSKGHLVQRSARCLTSASTPGRLTCGWFLEGTPGKLMRASHLRVRTTSPSSSVRWSKRWFGRRRENTEPRRAYKKELIYQSCPGILTVYTMTVRMQQRVY